jgi:hypothetical protein
MNKVFYMMPYFMLALLIIAMPAWIHAEQSIDPKTAKQYITDILSHPDFDTTREESRWRYLGEWTTEETPEPQPSISFFSGLIGGIAQLFELLLWLLVGVGIILLVLYGSRWLKQWQPEKAKPKEYVATPRLLNQELKKGTVLSNNLSEQAWTLWQSGKPVAAISLLYRGALSVLKTRDCLTIHDSATENECLRLVKKQQPTELSEYFFSLTRAWQTLAYANRQPTEIEAQRLCHEWPQYFLMKNDLSHQKNS